MYSKGPSEYKQGQEKWTRVPSEKTHPANIRDARPGPAPISHHTSVGPPPTLNDSTTSDDPFSGKTGSLDWSDLLSRFDVPNVMVPESRHRLLLGKRLPLDVHTTVE